MANKFSIMAGSAGLLLITVPFLGFHSAEADTATAAKSDMTGVIDRSLQAEWKRNKITPAGRTDDARFLRRVTLDITGALPAPDEVTEFLSDKSPTKRAEAVERLLASPRYVKNWVDYWDQTLLGRQVRAQVVDRTAFRDWLTSEFKKNTPFNQFTKELLTATGRNSNGGSYAKALGMPEAAPALNARKLRALQLAGKTKEADAMMKAGQSMDGAGGGEMAMDASGAGGAAVGPLNGATNFYLKYQQTPADLSGAVSKIFLGVQIQCAQCHDHKTEKWKQEDFRKFTACFVQTRAKIIDDKDVKGVKRVEFEDLNLPPRALKRLANRPAVKVKENGRAEYLAATPAALDGSDFTSDPNRREALANWITSNQNPWFAQAIVNRMWAHFLGRGFVDPIDDFRTTNPANMPELLKKISDDFVVHNYDLKYLIRTICATQAYQISSGGAVNNVPGNTLWASFRLKSPEPEALVDMLITATGMENVLDKAAPGSTEQIKFGIQRQLVQLFDVDEEFEQKEYEGTIPQALMLLNGKLANTGASVIPGTALGDLLKMDGDDTYKITALYLRTVSRKPTMTELSYWREFLSKPRMLVMSPDANPPVAPQIAARRRRLMQQAGNQLPPAPKVTKKSMNKQAPDPLNRLDGRLRTLPQTAQQQAYEDMFWTLLNSSEFIFNH